jgi:hypothetical protein
VTCINIYDSDNKFLISLAVVAFLVRFILAPFFFHPHDMYAYINAGEAILNGSWYTVIPQNITLDEFKVMSNYLGPYGPMLGLFYAPLIILFNHNYFALKFPSIFFDALNIVIIYYIVRELRSPKAARYASIFYAFSYLAIYSVAAQGNNDNYELFFLLTSLYLLVKQKPNITASGIFMGLSLGFVFIPAFTLLPVLYYLYQREGIKKITNYLAAAITTLFLILLPFYLKAGVNILYPYIGFWVHYNNWPEHVTSIDGMSIPNLFKMLTYYLTTGAGIPYNTYEFPAWTSTVSVLVGAFKFRMRDKKIELVRNIFLIFFLGLVFFSEFFFLQLPWILPFVYMMMSRKDVQGNLFSLTWGELAGIALLLIGAGIHVVIFQEYIPYTPIERFIILLGVFLVFAGTYLKLVNTDIALSWSMVMFSGALFTITDARPLRLLSPYIPLFESSRFVWGVHYFASIVLMLASMALLFYTVHRITREM